MMNLGGVARLSSVVHVATKPVGRTEPKDPPLHRLR